MKRRDFLPFICGAIAALPRLGHAQTGRIPRIGVLWHAGSAEEEGAYYTGLGQGFRDLGYVEGRNIHFDHRFPNEMPERFQSMIAELVALKVDVLVTVGTQTAPYARDATTSIPVVFIFVPDPVGSKFVESLARPGRNMTGLSQFGADIVLKRLQHMAHLNVQSRDHPAISLLRATVPVGEAPAPEAFRFRLIARSLPRPVRRVEVQAEKE